MCRVILIRFLTEIRNISLETGEDIALVIKQQRTRLNCVVLWKAELVNDGIRY